jgi:uncharacterized protein (DUF427 family)
MLSPRSYFESIDFSRNKRLHFQPSRTNATCTEKGVSSFCSLALHVTVHPDPMNLLSIISIASTYLINFIYGEIVE